MVIFDDFRNITGVTKAPKRGGEQGVNIYGRPSSFIWWNLRRPSFDGMSPLVSLENLELMQILRPNVDLVRPTGRTFMSNEKER